MSLVFSPAGSVVGTIDITARFNRADGVRVGTLVRAAGVDVGQVEELDLDEDFRAVTVLRINSDIVLDSDASAAIVSDSLFGGKFIRLDVGAGDGEIGNGQEIVFTQDAVVLDDLLELIISQARQARGVDKDAATEDQP